MKINFMYWYNEIADMPMRDENGEWYDAETGFKYEEKKQTRARSKKSNAELSYGHLKANDLKNQVERLVNSQRYAINKFAGKVDTSAAEAVVEMYESMVKPTKAQLYEVIEANSKASRIMNELTNSGRI